MSSVYLRGPDGPLQAQVAGEGHGFTLLTAAGPGGRSWTVPILNRAPEESTEGWVGRLAYQTSLVQGLAGADPLVPALGPVLWARDGGGPWVPVQSVTVTAGRPLSALITEGRLTMDVVWRTLFAVIRLLRAAQQRGYRLDHLGPEELMVGGDGQPSTCVAWADWRPRGSVTQDSARLVAHLLHKLLCGLDEKQVRLVPQALWTLCARGLDGHYGRLGLFRYGQDLRRVAPAHLMGEAGPPRAAIIIDYDGVTQALKAELDPIALLEELVPSGLTTVAPILLFQGELAPAVERAWGGSGFALVRGALGDGAQWQERVPAGAQATIVAGGADLTGLMRVWQKRGNAPRLIGFSCQCEAGPLEDGFQQLRTAIHLTQHWDNPERGVEDDANLSA